MYLCSNSTDFSKIKVHPPWSPKYPLHPPGKLTNVCPCNDLYVVCNVYVLLDCLLTEA